MSSCDGCGLSNVDGREGLMTRVEMRRSQLVGFGFTRGEVRDLRVVDSSLQLASFTSATLHNVIFERVNLAEASFMDARLEAVAFVDCRLEGADFRRRSAERLRDPRRHPGRGAGRRVPARPAHAVGRRPELRRSPGGGTGHHHRARSEPRAAAPSSWIGASPRYFPSRAAR